MPELPEVETIRRGLTRFIVGKKILRVKVFQDSIKSSFIGDSSACVSAEITGIRRFGKALVIDLDNGYSLMIHLRMTGQLIWRGAEQYAGGHPSDNFVAELPNKQTRVEFGFSDGVLYFNDQRRFGFIKVIATDEVEQDNFIRKLAKEPWEIEPEELYKKFIQHAKSPVKALILDQTIICGLGNIYVDESLFFAGIHPETRAGDLELDDVKRIVEGARKAMQESIDSGGSTMATYVRADGTKGDYLEKFAKVFRREGLECMECGAKIIKIRVAGRGTHICPNCQRKK